MLPFKQVLFPVDFSEQSFSGHAIGAARYVEAFTRRFDARLTLLHVIAPPNYNDVLPQSLEHQRARLERYLAKELEYFRVERVLVQGDPGDQILKMARERGCDLIMMPTHGAGGFRRFLVGSVTAKVLREADCPVWTGAHLEKTPPLEKIEFRRFLCAVNRAENAGKVIDSAWELAEEYRACLTVVHAAETPEKVAEARRYFCEKVRGAYLVVETGEVADVVARAAKHTQTDMLIIGRSPARAFGTLREHSYPLIRQSPCPILSV